MSNDCGSLGLWVNTSSILDLVTKGSVLSPYRGEEGRMVIYISWSNAPSLLTSLATLTHNSYYLVFIVPYSPEKPLHIHITGPAE